LTSRMSSKNNERSGSMKLSAFRRWWRPKSASSNNTEEAPQTSQSSIHTSVPQAASSKDPFVEWFETYESGSGSPMTIYGDPTRSLTTLSERGGSYQRTAAEVTQRSTPTGTGPSLDGDDATSPVEEPLLRDPPTRHPKQPETENTMLRSRPSHQSNRFAIQTTKDRPKFN